MYGMFIIIHGQYGQGHAILLEFILEERCDILM